MQVGREIGGLDWKEVTALRKAMCKSLGQEYFDQFGNKWKAGAMAKGIPKDVADKFWFDLCAFGSWGFNKSHAVSYGLVCILVLLSQGAVIQWSSPPPRWTPRATRPSRYSCCGSWPTKVSRTSRWTKTCQPINGNRSKREGQSSAAWAFSNIAGIGPKGVQEIMTCRRPGAGQPSKALLEKLEQGKTLIDSLTPIADRAQGTVSQRTGGTEYFHQTNADHPCAELHARRSDDYRCVSEEQRA